MIDIQTRREIRVSTGGTAGPYIVVPLEQLARVRAILNEHGISYWVEPDAISLDEKPAVAIVNLGLSGDARKVQELLDDAA